MNDSECKANGVELLEMERYPLWLQCPSGAAAAEGEVMRTGFQDHHV